MRAITRMLLMVVLSLALPAWAGGYAGLAVGQGRVSLDAPDTVDQGDTAPTVGALLGYTLTPHLAVEGGYTDLGRYWVRQAFTDGTYDYTARSTADASALYVAAVGRVALTPRLSAFGLLGLHHYDLQVGTDVAAYSGGTLVGTGHGDDSASGTEPLYGLGAEVALDRTLALRVDWHRYTHVGNDRTGRSDVDVLGGAALVRF